MLQYIPKKYITAELCEKVIKTSGLAIKHVPHPFRTPQLCELAVINNSDAVTRMLRYEQTEKVYAIAASKTPKYLSFLRSYKLTYEQCQRSFDDDVTILPNIRCKMRTDTMYKRALSYDGDLLRHVPKDELTIELCMIAVSCKSSAIEWCGIYKSNLKLCKMAVAKDGAIICKIPEKLRTYEMYKLAAKTYGDVIRIIPKSLMTYDIVLTAVKNCGTALRYVREFTPDKLIYETAIRNDPTAITCIRNRYCTMELHELAISLNGENIKWAPKTYRLELIAVKQTGKALKYVRNPIIILQILLLEYRRQQLLAFLLGTIRRPRNNSAVSMLYQDVLGIIVEQITAGDMF